MKKTLAKTLALAGVLLVGCESASVPEADSTSRSESAIRLLVWAEAETTLPAAGEAARLGQWRRQWEVEQRSATLRNLLERESSTFGEKANEDGALLQFLYRNLDFAEAAMWMQQSASGRDVEAAQLAFLARRSVQRELVRAYLEWLAYQEQLDRLTVLLEEAERLETSGTLESEELNELNDWLVIAQADVRRRFPDALTERALLLRSSYQVPVGAPWRMEVHEPNVDFVEQKIANLELPTSPWSSLEQEKPEGVAEADWTALVRDWEAREPLAERRAARLALQMLNLPRTVTLWQAQYGEINSAVPFQAAILLAEHQQRQLAVAHARRTWAAFQNLESERMHAEQRCNEVPGTYGWFQLRDWERQENFALRMAEIAALEVELLQTATYDMEVFSTPVHAAEDAAQPGEGTLPSRSSRSWLLWRDFLLLQ